MEAEGGGLIELGGRLLFTRPSPPMMHRGRWGGTFFSFFFATPTLPYHTFKRAAKTTTINFPHAAHLAVDVGAGLVPNGGGPLTVAQALLLLLRN